MTHRRYVQRPGCIFLLCFKYGDVNRMYSCETVTMLSWKMQNMTETLFTNFFVIVKRSLLLGSVTKRKKNKLLRPGQNLATNLIHLAKLTSRFNYWKDQRNKAKKWKKYAKYKRQLRMQRKARGTATRSEKLT